MYYFVTYFWSVFGVWELWDQIQSFLWGDLIIPGRGETFTRGRSSTLECGGPGPCRPCLDYPPKDLNTHIFSRKIAWKRSWAFMSFVRKTGQDCLIHCPSSHWDKICSGRYIHFNSPHKLLVSLRVLYIFTTRWFFYLFHFSIHGICWLNFTWSYCFGLE